MQRTHSPSRTPPPHTPRGGSYRVRRDSLHRSLGHETGVPIHRDDGLQAPVSPRNEKSQTSDADASSAADFKEQLLRDHLSVRTTMRETKVPSYKRGKSGIVCVARGVQTDADMFISGSGLHESRVQRSRADALQAELDYLTAERETLTIDAGIAEILHESVFCYAMSRRPEMQKAMWRLEPAAKLADAAFEMAAAPHAKVGTHSSQRMKNMMTKYE